MNLPPNAVKTKLRAAEPVFGLISPSPDPAIAEMVGMCGFDFYMIDAEHGPITPAHAPDICRACQSVGVVPTVRVGQKDMKLVLQYLDAGMMGVMMPGLSNAAEVAALVQAMKYPPEGRRGLGPARAAGYMMDAGGQADYVVWANAQTLVWPQFEDAALLPELAAIAAIPGVDGFVIGPRDLSLAMGYPDGPDHPEVQAVIDQAITILRQGGVAAGMTAGTPAAARRQIERGATIILHSLPELIRQSGQGFMQGVQGADLALT